MGTLYCTTAIIGECQSKHLILLCYSWKHCFNKYGTSPQFLYQNYM